MPKKYTSEDLLLAVAKVKKGLSLRKASALTNVPVTTIKDHARGIYKNKITKHGGKYALTNSEEQALSNYIQYMGERGFPLTRKVIRKLANDIVVESGRPCLFNTEKGPSHKWLRNFLKRHKELSLRKPHGLEHVRSEIKPEQIEGFYSLLETTLNRLGIKDDPTRIFNFDETGFSSKIQAKEKIVVIKGTKHPYQPMVSVNGHITLQLAVSADGKTVAPLIIYSKNLPRNAFMDGIPDDWSFDVTDSGFINSEIFLSWFINCFSKQCCRTRPILVIMDNHVTHLDKKLIDFAQKDQIELLCLPSHSTHILQPLDVGYYHLLKENFTKLCVSLGYTGMKTIPREKFPKLLHIAMNKISGASISSAFSCVGICPFNQNKANSIIQNKVRSTVSVNKQADKKATDQNKSDKCEKCGHDAKEDNRLVKLGLIPEALKSILVVPTLVTEKRKCSKRKLDTARVLTYLEKKKVKSCNEKNVSADDKNLEVSEGEVLCEVCMTGNEELTWIGCDNCERWVHYECVGKKQQKLIDRSLKQKTKWLCNTCLFEE